MPKLRNTPPMKERKELFIKEYMKSYGILSSALSACQMTYNTYKKWFIEDDKFRDECLNVERVQGDLVENKLLDLIVQGNITAIIFYLKCRRGDRWNDRSGQLNVNITTTEFQIGSNNIDIIDMKERNLLE